MSLLRIMSWRCVRFFFFFFFFFSFSEAHFIGFILVAEAAMSMLQGSSFEPFSVMLVDSNWGWRRFSILSLTFHIPWEHCTIFGYCDTYHSAQCFSFLSLLQWLTSKSVSKSEPNEIYVNREFVKASLLLSHLSNLNRNQKRLVLIPNLFYLNTLEISSAFVLLIPPVYCCLKLLILFGDIFGSLSR